MHGIKEQEEHMLQNLKQNDTVCVRIYTEHGPYWNELRVKRLTKTQIITTDNQHFWKKDGSEVGGITWHRRIFPITEELEKIIEKRNLLSEETLQKRELIFSISCNLRRLSLDQLRQIDLNISDKAVKQSAGNS
jgi:hypothetical protein